MTSLHVLTPSLSKVRVSIAPSFDAPQGADLSGPLADLFAGHRAALAAKVAAGNIFDGPVAVLRGWRLTPTGLDLEIQSSTYVPMTAMRLTYVEAVQRGIISHADQSAIPSRFGACLCACVVVVTADNQIISLTRSARLSNAGTVSLALGEVLEPSDFEHGPLSLLRAGARALHEELGIVLTPAQMANCVKPMYLTRGPDCGSWVFVILADLRQAGQAFSADKVLLQAQSAQDSWESDARQAIACDRSSLDAFLRAHAGRLGLWAEDLVELLAAELE